MNQNIYLKNKHKVTSETWQHEGSPLVSPLEVTTSLTAMIQQRIPCTTTHKHV